MNIEQVVAEMPKAENPHSAALMGIYEEWKSGMLRPGITYEHFIKNALTTGAELNALIGGSILHLAGKEKLWKEATEAQCQLLAEQGYRPVPKVSEILNKLTLGNTENKALRDLCWPTAEMLHRWLLEGE